MKDGGPPYPQVIQHTAIPVVGIQDYSEVAAEYEREPILRSCDVPLYPNMAISSVPPWRIIK